MTTKKTQKSEQKQLMILFHIAFPHLIAFPWMPYSVNKPCEGMLQHTFLKGNKQMGLFDTK